MTLFCFFVFFFVFFQFLAGRMEFGYDLFGFSASKIGTLGSEKNSCLDAIGLVV